MKPWFVGSTLFHTLDRYCWISKRVQLTDHEMRRYANALQRRFAPISNENLSITPLLQKIFVCNTNDGVAILV